MRRPYSLYALQFYKKRRGTSDGGVGPLGPMRWLCSLHALRKKGNKSGRQWKKRTKLGRCNSLRFERSAGQHAGQHAAGYSHCHTHKHTHTPACRLIWPICETWNSMLCRLQPHTHTHTHTHTHIHTHLNAGSTGQYVKHATARCAGYSHTHTHTHTHTNTHLNAGSSGRYISRTPAAKAIP